MIGWKKLDNCQFALCDSKTGQSSLRTQELKQILRSLAGSGSEGGCETLHRYLVDSTVSLSLKARECNLPSVRYVTLYFQHVLVFVLTDSQPNLSNKQLL